MRDIPFPAAVSRVLLLSIAIASLTACSPATETDEPAASGTTTDIPTLEVQPTMPTSPQRIDLEHAADLAVADLAGRLGIEQESIESIEARHVTWRSGAMGCPEPDMMYTQALVPGYRILLRVGKDVHAYHGARGVAPFYCPADRADEPLPEDDDLR